MTTLTGRNETYFPAEFARHRATVMIWCERAGSWTNGGADARPVFARIIREICAGEKVYLCASEKGEASAREMLAGEIAQGKVQLFIIPTDDCWARDIAPTFVIAGGGVCGIDWRFNGWGGDYNGLYKVVHDDLFAQRLLEKTGYSRIDAHPFVLEGGSVHTNGKGTLLTTEECLLSKGRNPTLGKREIEDKLKFYLGAKKVVWLKRGIYGDETDGHVDNVCAFCGENTVLLAWSDEGIQGEICRENLKILQESGLEVVKLPLPEKPVTVNGEELSSLSFEEGEQPREEGETLAASYVNFYVCNAGVLVPQFGDKNDEKAVKILKSAFAGRKIIPVPAREIIIGGGNIHCLTQQIPY